MSGQMKSEITIKITIKGSEIELNEQDARELFNELGRIFNPSKVEFIQYPANPTTKVYPFNLIEPSTTTPYQFTPGVFCLGL